MSRVVRVINNEPKKTEMTVGLIAPNEGRVNEEEFPAVYPEEVALLIASLRIGEVTAENVERIVAPPGIENAARALAKAGADIIIQCGTPLVFANGYGYDKTLIERITSASGLPATTMCTSVVEALKKLGVKHPVVVTPYPLELDRRLAKYLDQCGLPVAAIRNLGLDTAEVRIINLQPPQAAYQLAKETFLESKNADGIFISCGGFRTVTMIARLEAELKVPATSSALSTIWKSLDMLGHKKPITGYGSLLENP